MIVGVADTHVFVWYLDADSRLSATAKTFIDRATEAGAASALAANVPVISRDSKIQAANLTTVW